MELLSTCRHVSKRTVCWNLGPILTTTRHFCSVFSKRRGLASSTRVGHNCSMDSSSLLPLREPDGLKPLMIFTFREGEDFYMHNFWDYLIKFCLWKLKLCLWKSKLCLWKVCSISDKLRHNQDKPIIITILLCCLARNQNHQNRKCVLKMSVYNHIVLTNQKYGWLPKKSGVRGARW